MRHVIDALLQHGPIQESWVVVGKGPSFDAARVIDSHLPICCLNETANTIGKLTNQIDLCLMNDRMVLRKIKHPAIDTCDLFGLANGPHHFAAPEEVTVSFFASVALTMHQMGKRLTYFDLRTCSARSFPDHPQIQSHFSVYETALWILGYAGVKRILTTGVDGGSAYHETFGPRDEKYRNTDLTPQFERARVPMEQFGLKVEKL